MSIVDQFESFAADFEICVSDDSWARLEKYFVENATYLNVGGLDPIITGRAAILAFLKNSVESTDRRFDSRDLVALTPPKATGNRLSRKWRCTYKLSDTPDLVVEGEARYEYEGELIRTIEEELTPESMESYLQWMKEYGSMLHA